MINHKSFNPERINKMVAQTFKDHGDTLESVYIDYRIVTLNTPGGKYDQLVPMVVYKCREW